MANPAELHPYDADRVLRAAARLADIRRVLGDLPGAADAEYDHIGSTSVPGLAAKPYIDLQVRILPLPSEADLISRLGEIGFVRAIGSRPDSPGVNRDVPRGDEDVPEDVWDKRLFLDEADGTILHIRRTDSPFGRHTVWFRDWMRANPAARDRYEATKRRMSAENEGKPDYDDYTRAKSAFFDEVQAEFIAWARSREIG